MSNNSELNFYQQLVKLAGQHEAVETPAPEGTKEAEAAPATETIVAVKEEVKIASVTDMTVDSMLEHPDFLRGVMDTLARRNLDLEEALQRVVLAE